MKKNKSSEVLHIRLEPAVRHLLEHRAKIQHLKLSKYLRQLINVGLDREREILAGNAKYSKVEKILLKNSIETAMLVHYIIGQQNATYVEEVKQKSSTLMESLLKS